jgi:anthranilate phosphoribosyltransferase
MTPQAALQRVIEHREIFHDEMVSLMRRSWAAKSRR